MDYLYTTAHVAISNASRKRLYAVRIAREPSWFKYQKGKRYKMADKVFFPYSPPSSSSNRPCLLSRALDRHTAKEWLNSWLMTDGDHVLRLYVPVFRVSLHFSLIYSNSKAVNYDGCLFVYSFSLPTCVYISCRAVSCWPAAGAHLPFAMAQKLFST